MNSPPARLQIIELLRAVASLGVAWFHLTGTQTNTAVVALGQYGWLGVDVFFVISGFIIPYSMQAVFGAYRLSDAPTFLVRRAIRLEPPYVISIGLVIVLWHLSSIVPGFAGQSPDYTFGQIAAHLFYIIPLTDFKWLQPVYWTLAFEFAYYVFMALMLPALSGRHRLLVVLSVLLIAHLLVLIETLPARVLLFAVGFLVFRLKSGDGGRLEVAVVVASVALAMGYRGDWLQGLVGAATAFAVLQFLGLEVRGFLARIIGWFGALSYSLYLVHVPIGGRVVNIGRRFADSPFEVFAVSVAALITSLIAAWALWSIVERPAMRAARLWGRNRAALA